MMIEFLLPIVGNLVFNGTTYEGTREWKMLFDEATGTIYFKRGDGKGAPYFTLNKDQIKPFVKSLEV